MEFLKKFSLRRVIVMMAGLIIMSFGIAVFKFANQGNDPCNAFLLGFSGMSGIDYALMGLLANCFFFVAEFIWGRKYIGIGTFANWFCVVPVANFFMTLMAPIMPAEPTLLFSICLLIPGILVLALSVSLYQSADLGVAPYDALALALRDKSPLPYFWARIIIDACFAVLAALCGGIIGLGTLICALGLGPFITFFDNHVSRKLVGDTQA